MEMSRVNGMDAMQAPRMNSQMKARMEELQQIFQQAASEVGVDLDLSSGPQAVEQQLESLKTSDPEKFTKLLNTIADKLGAAAESSTDERQSELLTKMSDNFRSAAETGDIPKIRPPKRAESIQGAYNIGTQRTNPMEALFSEAAAEVGVTLDISEDGKALSQLDSLKKTDPENFKQLLNTIADKLSAGAATSTNDMESEFLSKMADNFRSAADTGDTSKLRPPKGMGGRHATYNSDAEIVNSSANNAVSTLLNYMNKNSSDTSELWKALFPDQK